MREIKFKISVGGKTFGYERLTDNGWEWMAIDLNPDNGERWIQGVMNSDSHLQRSLFTGFKDENYGILFGEHQAFIYSLQNQ